MNLRSVLPVLLFACAGSVSAQEAAYLGTAPHADPALRRTPSVPQVQAATAATSPDVAFSSGDRYQVSLAYLNTYVPEAGVAPAWTGSISPCNPGTTASAYQQATIERVNFYRVLAGLPGTVGLFGDPQATDTQAAALMFSANQQLSHTPSNTWTCWTQAGSDGAGNSNIALSYGSNAGAGPGAVDLYMDDDGSGNDFVGHRRWILFPPQVQMASGSIPYGAQYAANALWTLGPWGDRPAAPAWVAWPPAGYVPWQVLPANSNRWSLSIQNADFSSASVTVLRNGVLLGAPTIDPAQYNGQPNGTFIGDNTLVWESPGITYAQPVGADVVYHVTVSGIAGSGVPSSVSYDVHVIDPYDAIFADGFGG